MNDENPLMKWVWPVIASLAGSVTALSFRPFKSMGRGEIFMALFVGASFAIFVAPWVNFLVFGRGPVDVRLLGGIFYLMASGSNILIPFLIKKIQINLGFRETEPKE